MNLLKVLGIKSKEEKATEKVDFVHLDIPDMPLRERAIAAAGVESEASWVIGVGGYPNAIKKCSAIFGVKPSDCEFKKMGAGWYRVEIEDLVLMTEDYHEYFGTYYWLRIPCPYCGNMVRGDKMFSTLRGLGEAIRESGPCSKHFKGCLPWRTKCAEKFGDSSLVPTMDYKDWEHLCAEGI